MNRFVTSPLLLLTLLLTSAMPWPTIIWTVFWDWVVVICGLCGALTRTRWKWGWYAFGCCALLYIFWTLISLPRLRAKAFGNDVYRSYLLCGGWLLLIWLCYPISWGCSEGGNVIAPDSEAVFYGVLDFCVQPVYSILLILGHWNIDPARLGLAIRYGDEVAPVVEKGPGQGTTASNGAGPSNGEHVDGANPSSNGMYFPSYYYPWQFADYASKV